MIAELEQKLRTSQEELETLKTEVDTKISEYEESVLIVCVFNTCVELTRLSSSYAKNMRQRMPSLKQTTKN